MALESFKRVADIVWDTANKQIYKPILAKSGDSAGRRMRVQIVNKGVVEDLTGSALNLGWKTKNGAHKGLDAFTAIDITTGLFEMWYTTGMLSNVGKLDATLQIVDASGVIESDNFEINVIRSPIDADSIQSTDSFTALATALIEVQGVIAGYIASAETLEETYAPRLAEVEGDLEEHKKPHYALQLGTIVDTSINSLTQRKNWQPMLLAVKESNIPNRPADNADQSPRPIGWLYYNVDTSSPSGYKLLYASGKPDNIVQSFDWNSTLAFEQKTPEYFSFFITRPGDIIVLYRGEKETRAEHGRKNPIVYPYNDLANPVVVDLSSKAVKPTSWLMSCGAEYMYTSTKNYFMFGEYTRPIHDVTNIWKVDPPFTNPENWNIVKSEPTSGSNTEGFEHFHMINYDPICGAIYASNGDDEASTKIWESRDNGTTWAVVASGIQNARVCNLIFTKDFIYWASDEPTAHVLNRVGRVVDSGNGFRYGDFSNIVKLTDLPAQQASYGTLLLHNPPGLLMMDRFDDYIEGRKLQVPFWSFDTNSLHIIKEVSPHPQAIYDGLVFSGWGFRPNAYQKYQGLNDKRIVMGFDHTHPNYSNLMDVLDNNPGFYQPYIEKLHNMSLEVVRTNVDGY